MWTKICGIRDVATANDVAQLSPAAIGLNFYARTPRCVPVDTASEIVQRLPPGIEPVALFVNHEVQEIVKICGQSGIRTVQLHGDEPPTFLADLQAGMPDVRIIRAHRMGVEGLSPLRDYLQQCRQLDVELTACLIDARVEGAFGGTGESVPWDQLKREYQFDQWPPLILAGGLNPQNVGDATRAVRPWGVDVSSGVESSPAQKDLALVDRFLQSARIAAEEIASVAANENNLT